jgi:hypothetical protein
VSRRYRLLAELPLEVVFKSRNYFLATAELPVAGEWQLQAVWSGGYWLCAHGGSEGGFAGGSPPDGLGTGTGDGRADDLRPTSG